MEALLGLVMIYSWIHAGMIINKRISNTTQYENVVLIVGLVGFVLIILNIINGQ